MFARCGIPRSKFKCFNSYFRSASLCHSAFPYFCFRYVIGSLAYSLRNHQFTEHRFVSFFSEVTLARESNGSRNSSLLFTLAFYVKELLSHSSLKNSRGNRIAENRARVCSKSKIGRKQIYYLLIFVFRDGTSCTTLKKRKENSRTRGQQSQLDFVSFAAVI